MTADGPFFLSDPRPLELADPDDPRPLELADPDDPRPLELADPDDPRPLELADPDDPRPLELADPDDPRPLELADPDDPRPLELADPDDPAVRYRQQGPGSHAERCRPPSRKPPRCRPTRRRFPLDYSGNIVVRLSGELDLARVRGAGSLPEAARELGLRALRRLLRRYRISARATRRLVDVRYRGKPVETGQIAGADWSDRCQGPRVRPMDPEEVEREQRRTELTTVDLERMAATSELPPRHSLESYWAIDVRDQPLVTEPVEGETRLNGWAPSHRRTVRRLVRELNELPEVDLAYRELAVSDPQPQDTLTLVQDYLDRAPIGVDARWVWRQAPAEEWRVGVIDLEQGWIDHEDLPIAGQLVFGDNRHGEGEYRGHHGTAVLGEMVAGHNRLGVRGVARGARWVRLSSHYDKGLEAAGNVANAIRHAIARMDAGDVLLLEVQRSYLPTEADHVDRDAIRLAVALGIVVVEAAGNGNANLDRYVDEEGERVLWRRHPEFLESGAIMIGAARADPPHDRFWGKVGVGSNHGSRIDCFAYGSRVVTTGYGDLDGYLDPPGTPRELAEATAYSASFAGTSGAAPIIAGAAVVVQGLHEARAGNRLSPWEMRRLLASPATGTRQGRGVRGRIGVMPDLKRIVRDRLGLVPDLYLADRPGDAGDRPVSGRIHACPDIVVTEPREGVVVPPPEALAEGYHGIGRVTAGTDYSVFVRVRNRGHVAVRAPRVRLFWSEVATLVTPAMWHQIDTPGGLGLAGGAGGVGPTPAWCEAIPWRAPASDVAPGAAPAAAHFCLTAIATDPEDDEVVLPPGRPPYFGWRRFLWFLRRHNEVALRNLHLVDGGGGQRLPFLVTGTPDRARAFDLEILRDLPPDVTLELAAHPALASRLRKARLWAARRDGERIVLTPPARRRVAVERVRLVADAAFPCSFLVGGGAGEGHSLAIRQLYRGREVGRITWRFRGK